MKGNKMKFVQQHEPLYSCNGEVYTVFYIILQNSKNTQQIRTYSARGSRSTRGINFHLSSENKHPGSPSGFKPTKSLKNPRGIEFCLLDHRESRQNLLGCNPSRLSSILEWFHTFIHFLNNNNKKND